MRMMRVAAAMGALAVLAAPGVSAAQSGWTYQYIEGIAIATQRNLDGDVTATMTCRPPDGVLVITDHTFNRAARGVETAAVRVGALSINVPAESQGRGRRARVTVDLPQSPPVLAGVRAEDELSVTVNGTTHTYGRGSGQQMKDVAYACWTGGS